MTIDITLLEIVGLIGMELHAYGLLVDRACDHDGPHLARGHGVGTGARIVPVPGVAGVSLFGRGKFQGYVKARRAAIRRSTTSHRRYERKEIYLSSRAEADPKYFALEELAETPFRATTMPGCSSMAARCSRQCSRASSRPHNVHHHSVLHHSRRRDRPAVKRVARTQITRGCSRVRVV